jgi:hypothetical protein
MVAVPSGYDPNKFEVKGLILGKKEDWFKAWRYGLLFAITIGVLFFIVYGAYRIWKPTDTKQVIKVEKGGQATIVQKTGDKRWFILFAEPYVGVSTNTKSEGRGEVGGRVGARFEF